MRELFHSTKVINVIPPITNSDNTARVGSIVDHAGFEAAMYVIAYGNKTDGVVTVLLEEGDDAALADAAAVADADLHGTEALVAAADGVANANKIGKLGYQGNKRYTRLTLTPSSNAGSLPLAAQAILTGARHNPVQAGDGSAVVQVP